MRTIIKISLFALATFAMIGCAPPANTNTNTAANTNANTGPKAAAPTADTFMPMENKAFEAWKAKDGKYFDGYVGDSFVADPSDPSVKSKADVVKMINESKCDVKSFALSEGRVTTAGADVAVFTYKATADATCEGKPIPSPVTAATVFVRSADSWKAVYHNEVAVIAPKADMKADNSNASAAKAPAAAEKKEAPAAAPAAKDEKPAANSSASNSNSASSNSNAAAGSGDALTDALMAVERKGWEGWKNQDAKALEETVSNDVAFIDPTGKPTYGKADVLKGWTNGECKVTSVSLSDAKGTSLSKDAAILTYKGTAVGSCGDMKLEPLWAWTVAVKEGETWKAVYIFEKPVGKM